MLKARLLVISALTNMYILLERAVHDARGRRISRMKLMGYIAGHMDRCVRILSLPTASDEERRNLVEALVRHCCYDLRRKRHNFSEIMSSLA
jgi:hypothetical protein